MSLSQQPPEKSVKSISSTVLSIVSLTSSILTIASVFTISFIATIIAWVVHQQWIIMPLAFFSSGIFVSLVLLGLFQLKYSFSQPTRWLLRGYRWVKAEYLYCIEDDILKHHSQIIKIRLKAARPGVNLFENKYSWTGLGEEKKPLVVSKGHELMGFYGHRRWKYYYIYLGYELARGEEVEVIIKQELNDQAGTFEPFLAKTITESVESLKLRVLLPENCSLTKADNCELKGTEHSSKILKKVTSIRNTIGYEGKVYKELSYEILKPRLNRRYEIRWEW